VQYNLLYSNSTLCQLDSVRNRTGDAFVLMVDRGDCTFVTKVRNAQEIGAKAVIVANNACICSDLDCNEAYPDDTLSCDTQAPIMADDGSGADIIIPSFLLIYRDEADLIREAIIASSNNGTFVILEISRESGGNATTVEVDFFTVPTDPLVHSVDFLQFLKAAALAFGEDASFTPFMYIYNGNQAGCQVDNEENACGNLCTNAGLYCAVDPDGDLDSGVSGAQVVVESLRRLCIWDVYGGAAEDGIGEPWWNYVIAFTEMCFLALNNDSGSVSSTLFTNQTCIEESFAKANINSTLILECIEESGGVKGGVNSKFEFQLQMQEENNVLLIPSFFLNGFAFPFAASVETPLLAAQSLFLGICVSYSLGEEPPICEACSGCSPEDLFQCLSSNVTCETTITTSPTFSPTLSSSSQPVLVEPSFSPRTNQSASDLFSSTPTEAPTMDNLNETTRVPAANPNATMAQGPSMNSETSAAAAVTILSTGCALLLAVLDVISMLSKP